MSEGAGPNDIFNIYKMFLLKGGDKSTMTIVSDISNTLGIAKSTVYRVVRYKEKGQLIASKNSPGRYYKLKTLDENVKNSVRRIVHSFFLKNELATLNKLMVEINEDRRNRFMVTAHCELSPIELVWAQMKGKVAS